MSQSVPFSPRKQRVVASMAVGWTVIGTTIAFAGLSKVTSDGKVLVVGVTAVAAFSDWVR